MYLRMLPEAGLTSVAHTKQVTSGAASSSSTSSTLQPEGGINFYLGYLAPASGDWLFGGEIRGAISIRPTIEGRISREGTGPDAVWPGPWDFANRVGLGAHILLGRTLTSGNTRGFVFAGIARWNSDFRSAGADPDPRSDELIDDRQKTGRWPLTAGIGTTLPLERPLDIRLRVFRSSTSWTVSRDVNQNALQFDYTFNVTGLALSVGLGTR